jgi:vacuolar-type H+-ATPase subunit H
MVNLSITSNSESDEFSQIFDEYRAKIDEIVRKKNELSRHLADEESTNIVNQAWKKAEEIISNSQQESQKIHEEIEQQAKKESSKIINEAKIKAQRIVDEIEERVKKEAKNRSKSEVDKIIAKAREESKNIISRARQIAEKERLEIIEGSKLEAEQLINDITEKCREETQTQSLQVVNEAQKKAEKMIANAVTSSAEISKLFMEIMHKTKTIMDGFENELNIEFSEFTKVIDEAKKKLEKSMNEAIEVGETKLLPSNINNEELNENSVLLVQLKADKCDEEIGFDTYFSGQMELKTMSPSFDYRQIMKLRDHLLKFPGVICLTECASEKEMIVLFEVKEPLLLLDILNNIPSVDRVITQDDGINLVLGNHNKLSGVRS